MNPSPVAILYTQDQDLVRRVKAFLRMIAQVRHVAEADRLDAVLQQTGPALLLIDLRAKESRELLDQVQKDWPEVLITALGTPRSEPLRDAEEAGIYAAEDLQLDRTRFQALVGRAFDLLRVMQENRELREESSQEPIPEQPRRAAEQRVVLRLWRVSAHQPASESQTVDGKEPVHAGEASDHHRRTTGAQCDNPASDHEAVYARLFRVG